MGTNQTQKGYLCDSGETIVIACSGASDLGQVSDIVARKLRDNNVFKMNCLADVGADVTPTIETFKAANLLIFDGCAVDCGKKILDKAGIINYQHIRITDLGYAKGRTTVTDEVINAVYKKFETCV